MFAVKVWSKVLDPDFGIPSDVSFKIIEDENEDICEERTVIPAHKYFLAVASPVFKAMFFGLNKETRKVIPIKGTSWEAFMVMIFFIYEKEICWKEKSIITLLEVVNLAEMYDLGGLMEEVEKPLSEFPLSPDSVMHVAAIARQFSHFQKVSSQLLSHCATFLATKVITTKDSRNQFASSYIDSPHYATAFKLLELVEEVPPAMCDNCLYVECEDRMPVSLASMRKGCRVMVRLGTYMEVIGRLVEECSEHSGHLWLVREEQEEVRGEETLSKVKLINLFYACKD